MVKGQGQGQGAGQSPDSGQGGQTPIMQPPQGVPASVEASAPAITPPASVSDGAGSATSEVAGNGANGDGSRGGVIFPPSALKRLKAQQRMRGKKEALRELASQMGFRSVEDMQDSLRAAQNGGDGSDAVSTADVSPEAAASNGGAAQDPALKKLERDNARLLRENQALQERARRDARQRRRAQREKYALEAEASIRQAAVVAGVKDVDYGMSLLARHLKGKSLSEIAKFDERKFFENLRAERPYLFGEVVKPATTGTGTGSAPPAPAPGAAGAAAAQGGQPDAKKMSPEQFRDHLSKRGLNLSV